MRDFSEILGTDSDRYGVAFRYSDRARWTSNPEVTGSNPTGVTFCGRGGGRVFVCLFVFVFVVSIRQDGME